MAQEEPAPQGGVNAFTDPAARLRALAPWLAAPELGVCIVGSVALAEECRRAGITGPPAADLDLAWAASVEQGEQLLASRDLLLPTTPANRARGTLACRLGEQRIEITTFRDGTPDEPLELRLQHDLAARDMTIGALAWRLSDDQILDPHGGLDDWRAQLIRPVGNPEDRILEHPVRWLRYYRRAHQWDFRLDPLLRRIELDPALLRSAPAEAIAAELRAGLLECRSPGRFLLELHEASLLDAIAPELAAQFDGRPAGPQRHHPEVSQALHLILTLEWAARRTRELNLTPEDRSTVMLASLCHDLGKGHTPRRHWPSHHAHERSGIAWIRTLFERLPGFGDQRARHFCERVCALHLLVRRLRDLRPGSLAKLYDDHFRDRAFRADLFALTVAADSAGRLGRDADADSLRTQIERDITWLRERCESVDAQHLRSRHGEDLPAFRRALHQAWARAIGGE